MRTFHIGGAATAQKIQNVLINESPGRVKFYNLRLIENRKGEIINISREGAIGIEDGEGRVVERHAVPYGAKITVKEGQEIPEGTSLAEWDPFNTYIIAEEEGRVELRDIILDVTVREERDALTGKTATIISFMRPKDAMLHTPRVVVVTDRGEELTYDLPVNSILNIPAERMHLEWSVCPTCSEAEEAQIQHRYYVVRDLKVKPGDVLARIPKEMAKVRDIVGGLPRVEELFEARKPKNPAIISEIDGYVKIYEDADEVIVYNASTGETRKYTIKKDELILVRHGQFIKKGQQITESITSDIEGQVRMKGSKGFRVIVYSKETGLEKEYLVPKGKHLLVKDGDEVKAGEPLTDGTPIPEEMLKVKGVEDGLQASGC